MASRYVKGLIGSAPRCGGCFCPNLQKPALGAFNHTASWIGVQVGQLCDHVGSGPKDNSNNTVHLFREKE